MLHTRIFTFNPLGTNCTVAWEDGSATCTVADPGMSSPDGADELCDFLSREKLTPDCIILTHGHFDHTWGVKRLLERFPGLPVYMHPADAETLRMGPAVFRGMQSFSEARGNFPTVDIADGFILESGGARWKVLATPGHTPGSVCWWCEDSSIVLSGDTLFAGSIGRTDLLGGDYDTLMKSLLEKVMLLPGDTDVIPGHGQPTSIAHEATSNPFLTPFNEPDGPWWEQDGLSISPND